MKFYGIDCQGYLKLQEVTDPANNWVAGDERKLVLDDVSGQIFIGTATTYEPLLSSGQSLPQDTYDQLDLVYHPTGGDVTQGFTSETLTGSGTRDGGTTVLETQSVRVTDSFIKLSDGSLVSSEITDTNVSYTAATDTIILDPSTPFTTDESLPAGTSITLTGASAGTYTVTGYNSTTRTVTVAEDITANDSAQTATIVVPGTTGRAGIRIEDGSILSDLDDITLYYDVNAAVDGDFGLPTHWRLDGGGYIEDPIATHSYISAAVTANNGDYFDKDALDLRYVRYQDGDGTTNLTWQDWLKITNDNLGDATPVSDATACRYMYRKDEAHPGFVRTSNWSEFAPGGSAAYASVTNVANTIVQRDGSGDIYATVGHLEATSAQYADLAEKYTCDPELAVGTVVEVSNGTEYEVVPCAFEKSPVVVGVVSENPAHLMNSDSEGLPIALTGRVPVRVVGLINKGDFIVPAGYGQARKGEPDELVFKIGIALESGLHEDEKLVECIIK